MKGDDSLARAGAALHDGDLVERTSHDAVLIGRDSRDDVAHATVSWGVDCVCGRTMRRSDGVGEVFVFEVCHRPIARDDATSLIDIHGLNPGGLVKTGRLRRAPIQKQWLTGVIP